MKKILTIIICIATFISSAQSGYEIKVKLKNYKDNLAYLAYYQFDKTFIKDTCANIKNGEIVFKGKEKLNAGIYAVVSNQKTVLFNFFVDHETQNLELKSDSANDFAEDLVALNSARQTDFLNYIKYIGKQNLAFIEFEKKSVLKTKADTLALLDKRTSIEKDIADYEAKFITRNKGTFIGSVINLKIEKLLKDGSGSAINLSDSTAFLYYKTHYWDGVDFTDDATMRNPFFYHKLNKYFEQVVPIDPDSVCVAVDKILAQTRQESLLYKTLLSHFTYTYETSPIMGFDKVFVYLVDNYFKTGRASTLYNDEVVLQNIINRADKLSPLLLGSVAPDLNMIRPQDYLKMREFGIEAATNSDDLTKLYYKYLPEITKLYVKLSEVEADYTILVFWDVDCGHCQDEISVLLKVYDEMIKQKIDVKVYSVYTQYDAEKYLKYITDHQLSWINVYDGARINNTIQKYDVFSTPVIYVLDKNKIIKAKRIEAGKIIQIIKTLELEK